MRQLFFIILFSLSALTVLSQNSKVRLAYKYYQNKEYEKAAVLFEELYKSNNAQVYFNYTVNCLVNIKEYDKAEKLIKKRIRRDKRNLQNHIELGYLYKQKEDNIQAQKEYDYVIKNLTPNKSKIINIANSFLIKREYVYANQTYLKGRKLIPYQFYLEMANAYAYQRKSQEMVEEYLNLLRDDPAKKQVVQNSLQSKMTSTYDANLNEVLRRTLIKRIQKEPKVFVYNELLIWYYIQEDNFGAAIIQAKALDRRRREGGLRLIELGEMALANNQFENAREAFEYVLEKEESSPFYLEAKLGYLDVLYKLVELGKIKSDEEIIEVETQYLDVIQKYNQPETVRLIKDLAHLQAFYLGKSKEAIKMLRQVIDNTRLDPVLRGVCKVELGDILLLENETADAILEYAQAAKLNENNETGDIAKLRRATVSFYTGNFIWAQAQLDVLKAGTSKLIANDAFKLSMLIKDNTGEDSIETPLIYYARAEMYLKQNKESLALQTLDSMEVLFQTHSLIDDVLYLKARIFESQGNYEKSVFYLEKVEKDYASGLLGDEAIYKLAQIHDYNLEDKKKAQQYYKKIIFDYPASIYVIDARRRFRFLRGDKQDKPG